MCVCAPQQLTGSQTQSSDGQVSNDGPGEFVTCSITPQVSSAHLLGGGEEEKNLIRTHCDYMHSCSNPRPHPGWQPACRRAFKYQMCSILPTTQELCSLHSLLYRHSFTTLTSMTRTRKIIYLLHITLITSISMKSPYRFMIVEYFVQSPITHHCVHCCLIKEHQKM